MANKIFKVCEFCGKQFETDDTKHGQRKRFCNTSCSAKWRIKTYGKVQVSEQGRKNQAESLSNLWKTQEFRDNNYKRMTENNPVYQEGVVEKANRTRQSHGKLPNNFIYGNGKISKYEKIAFNYLQELGFEYNIAIPTRCAREKFPLNNYPTSYKPDFTHRIKRICIEIDGPNHKHTKALDTKKDSCLKFLGYTVYRFTHEQIDSGEFYEKVDKLWENF